MVAKVLANPEIQIVHFTSPTFKLSFEGQTSFSLDKNTTDYFARLQSIVPSPSACRKKINAMEGVFAPFGQRTIVATLASKAFLKHATVSICGYGLNTCLLQAISCDYDQRKLSKLNAILPSFRNRSGKIRSANTGTNG